MGQSPDIPADIQVVNNIPFQYDFRSVYSSLLQQWFCVKTPELQDVLLQDFQALPLIQGGPCGLPEDIDSTNKNSQQLILKMSPNPYAINTTIQFSTMGGNTMIQMIDSLGQVIKILTNKNYDPGTYNIDVYDDGLPASVYFLRLQNNSLQKVITIVKASQ